MSIVFINGISIAINENEYEAIKLFAMFGLFLQIDKDSFIINEADNPFTRIYISSNVPTSEVTDYVAALRGSCEMPDIETIIFNYSQSILGGSHSACLAYSLLMIFMRQFTITGDNGLSSERTRRLEAEVLSVAKQDNTKGWNEIREADASGIKRTRKSKPKSSKISIPTEGSPAKPDRNELPIPKFLVKKKINTETKSETKNCEIDDEIVNMARKWKAFYDESMPWNIDKTSVESISEDLRSMQKNTGLATTDIKEVLDFIRTDPFWSKVAVSIKSLMKRRPDGMRKIDYLLLQIRKKTIKYISTDEIDSGDIWS